MSRPNSIGALLLCAAAGLTCASAAESTSGPDPRSLLQQIAGFSQADWSSVEAGTAVAKILETDSREIAVAGAVRIAASRDRLIARVREVEHLKRSAIVLDVGRFSRPPVPSDLGRAPLEDYSLDLRQCRPGECRVRMAAGDIERFHREVAWSAPDWRTRATSVWRDVLAGYASAYDRDGRKALAIYANKQESLDVAAELALLVEKSNFVASYQPEFYRYLREFGPARPAGTEDTLYWSKEDFGVRPVFRISHQVIQPARGPAEPVLVATNQVYADHYLDAALGLTLALDASEGRGTAFYMIAVNRARTRSLSGFLRRMVRGTVQSRSRDAMRRILTATKSGLEEIRQ
jgi:hypothetical protein